MGAHAEGAVGQLTIPNSGGDFVCSISSRNPVCPACCLAHHIAAVDQIEAPGPRVVVGSPRPQVATVFQNMLTQPPGRQIVSITACHSDVCRRDAEPPQLLEISRVEL
jgi:hypothetical protein